MVVVNKCLGIYMRKKEADRRPTYLLSAYMEGYMIPVIYSTDSWVYRSNPSSWIHSSYRISHPNLR